MKFEKNNILFFWLQANKSKVKEKNLMKELVNVSVDSLNKIKIEDDMEKKKLMDSYPNIVELRLMGTGKDKSLGTTMYEIVDDGKESKHRHVIIYNCCYDCETGVVIPKIIGAILFNTLHNVFGDDFDNVNNEGFVVLIDMVENDDITNYDINFIYGEYLNVAYAYGLHSSFAVLYSEDYAKSLSLEYAGIQVFDMPPEKKKKKKKDKKKKKK